MATICFSRVDSRLMHGQVMTQWLQRSGANRIVIVDDAVAADPNLTLIFQLCAPAGCGLTVLTQAEAARQWQESQLGDGKVFLLFSNPTSALDAHKQGLAFEELQIGGIGASAGSKLVHESIHLNPDQAHDVDELASRGVHIYFQMATSSRSVEWDAIRGKVIA